MANYKSIDFMGINRYMTWVSLALVAVSIGSLVVRGLNYGLDFTGGTQVEVAYSEPADLDQVRGVLAAEGFENYEAVYFGSDQDVLIRIQDTGAVDVDPQVAAQTGDRVLALLRQASAADIQLLRSEYVGSVVGEELREQGGLAMLVALGMMLIYIAMRFQFKFGIATTAALAEDVIITLGFFSLLQLSFDLTVLAALLAVIGYGLNDTIVICDRIRENFRLMRKTMAPEIVNISLTQTLGRTAITSGTTLLVLVSLALLGGEAMKGFAIALIVGVVIGTYSSIFVATKVLMLMKLVSDDLMPPQREREELDALP